MKIISDILDPQFIQAILVFAITTIVGIILAAKGRLRFGISQGFKYNLRNLEGPDFPVLTQQIWILNSGRATIDEVEIVFNFKPMHYEVADPRKYEESILPDGRMVLQFPYLAGQDHFTIALIETVRPELPWVVGVRCRSGLGRKWDLTPQRQLPNWAISFLWFTIMMGITFTAVILLNILRGIIT